MQHDPLYEQFVVLFTISIGLIMVGCGNALLGAGSRWRSVFIVAMTASACTGLVGLFKQQFVGWFIAGGLASVALSYLFTLHTVRSLLSRGSYRWSAVAAMGIALLLGNSWVYDVRSNALNEEMSRHFQTQLDQPPSMEVTDCAAFSDMGKSIRLKKAVEERTAVDMMHAEQNFLASMPNRDSMIRRQPPTDASNCHGWVFTGGRYNLGRDEVVRILAENHYAQTNAVAVHDLVVYRDNSQLISHTAIVRAVLPDGTILVESKWGRLGVFLHDVRGSCYGDQFEFYHSPREGHLIRGMQPVSPQPAPAPVASSTEPTSKS